MDQHVQIPTRPPAPSEGPRDAPRTRILQYSLGQILAVWALAALPMAMLAWIVAPRIAATLTGPAPLARALIVCLTIGMIWQFVLVAIFVGRERGSLRWSALREALWLRPPMSPRTGRAGGRLWLLLIPLIVAFAAEDAIPGLPRPSGRDLGLFLQSHVGQTFMHGAWGWFALLLVMFVFNTILGEELLFRGLLLPRMNGVFGRGDWVANGALFALYHLHVPWIIPTTLIDTLILAYPSKRYRSAWMGIIVHSAQTVVFALMALALVVKG